MVKPIVAASRSMPQNLRKAFPALAATVDERRRRNDIGSGKFTGTRGLTDSQREDIRDLHALCVSASDIANRLRLPQALVVDEIQRLSGGKVDA